MCKTASLLPRRPISAERQAEFKNRAITKQNEKICKVLRATTGQDFDANPREWWDWWLNYTEVYASGERPKEESYYTYQYNVPYYVPTTNPYRLVNVGSYGYGRAGHSYCFAKGTKVMAITGLTPIDELQTGDRVLAQDPDTGELAYKPIFRTTLRPQRPMLHVHVGRETITATLGHLFWVTGAGWKMTKELKPGDRLYGIDGEKTVESLEPAPNADAYNLVLADFGTYFVGESAVLVHDNSARKPTRTQVPGLTVHTQ